jgi:hypothetical protein
MSKYEFKSFNISTFENDKEEGWRPTYRVCQDYDDTPRDLEVVYLGANATYKEQVVSIDLKDGGAVRTHTATGLFSNDGQPCVLDIILYRDARPKPKEIRGMAQISGFGEVVAVVPDFIDGNTEHSKWVRCTITLHE